MTKDLALLVGPEQPYQTARFDHLDDDVLEGAREVDDLLVVVELAAVREPARPGIDRGDRV